MKRTLAERVAFLMLSAALAVGAWAVTGRAACSVTAPYQFPVQPGTPEWVELSANARRAACRGTRPTVRSTPPGTRPARGGRWTESGRPWRATTPWRSW